MKNYCDKNGKCTAETSEHVTDCTGSEHVEMQGQRICIRQRLDMRCNPSSDAIKSKKK
jgi:hypothetical protein